MKRKENGPHPTLRSNIIIICLLYYQIYDTQDHNENYNIQLKTQ